MGSSAAGKCIDLVVLMIIVHGSRALKCFQCEDTPILQDCLNIATCGIHEACFVEQYVRGGHALYRSGCRSNTQCPVSRSLGKRSDGSIVTCNECCNTDYCNHEGCGTKESLGIKCFSCPASSRPDLCRTIKYCNRDEMCYIGINEDFRYLNLTLYKTSCESSLKCEELAKDQPSLPHSVVCPPQCCKTSFCNNHCPWQPPATTASQTLSKTQHPTTVITIPQKTEHQATVVISHQTQHLTTDVPTQTMTNNSVISAHSSPAPPSTGSSSDAQLENRQEERYENGLSHKRTTGQSHFDQCKSHISQHYLYYPAEDLCFRLVTNVSITQGEASSTCQKEGSKLLTIDSSLKMDAVFFRIFGKKANDTDFWIGANYNERDRHFHWPDGKAVTFSSWGNHQPSVHSHAQDCLYMDHIDNYGWHDEDCGKMKDGYICEIVAPADQLRSRCILKAFDGFNYDKSTSMCLLVKRDPHLHNKTSAQQECAKHGATLLTLDSQAKLNFILFTIFSESINQTDFWIGAEYSYPKGQFVWPSGHTLAFTHWGHRGGQQPDGHPACVRMNYLDTYRWARTHCSASLTGYICVVDTVSFAQREAHCKTLVLKHFKYNRATAMCFSVNKVATGLTQAQAQQKCSQNGARLATLDSQDKMDAVFFEIFAHRANDTDYWIGATDMDHDGQYTWPNGAKMSGYSYWTMNEFTNCVLMNHTDNYKWYNADCNRRLSGYSCELVYSSSSSGHSRRTSSVPACPVGFLYNTVTGTCLSLHVTTNVTFHQAARLCKRDGAHLVTLANSQEMDALSLFISQFHSTTYDYWVGAHEGTSGALTWIDGSALHYTHWGSSDTVKDRCVYMDYMDNYYWHQTNCSQKLSGVFCEIVAPSDQLLSRCIARSFDGYMYDKATSTCIAMKHDITSIDQSAALGKCTADGAQLLTIDSQAKMDNLLYTIFSEGANNTNFWIGAEFNDALKAFSWPSGQKLVYSHWRKHGLLHPSPQSCVRLDHTSFYFWTKTPCDTHLQGYICELGQVPFSERETRCHTKPGFIYDQASSMCFSITMAISVTQHASVSACASKGGNLVTIDSKEKLAIILRNIKQSGVSTVDFWIGAMDNDHDGIFKWTNGNVVSLFSYWSVYQQQCVFLNHMDQFNWYNATCMSKKSGYICEKSPTKNQTSAVVKDCFRDVVFVLDSSGSIGNRGFNLSKTAIDDVILHLPIGMHGTQIAAVQFSSKVIKSWPLNRYHNLADLRQAVHSLHYSSGSSEFYIAIQHIVTNTFTAHYGDRANARNVLVFFSDGDPSEPSHTAEQLPALRNKVSDIITVPIITPHFHQSVSEFDIIATDGHHMVSSSSVHGGHLTDILVNLICKG